MEDKVEKNIAIFKKRKFCQLGVVFIVIPVVILMQSLESLEMGPEIVSYGQILGVGVIGALLLFSFYNWRCPACNKYLGKSGIPKFCPKCGEQIA